MCFEKPDVINKQSARTFPRTIKSWKTVYARLETLGLTRERNNIEQQPCFTSHDCANANAKAVGFGLLCL